MNSATNKPKLCVMQVLPALISGGVERGTVDIALALIQQGNQAIVVSSGGGMVKQLNDIGATHISLPVQSKKPWVMWKNAQVLKKIIQDYNVDIVHARSRAPAWSCYWASNHTKTPYITTFHGAYGHSNRLKRWYNSVMLKGNLTIAVSNFISEHIIKIYQPDFKNIQVIHRGIDTEVFSSTRIDTSRVDKLRKKWNISASKTVIMLPGRLTRLKGHSILINAISQMEHTGFICLFVGDNHGNTSYQNELETLIKKLKLEKTIQLVGGCNDMPAAYQLADIVISASIKPESFGRISCEAQAMNCLVVATNHGGTKEVLSPSQQLFLCEPNNSQAMYQALTKALTTPSKEQATIFKQSRKYIEANFSLDKMCHDTLAIYQTEADKKL